MTRRDIETPVKVGARTGLALLLALFTAALVLALAAGEAPAQTAPSGGTLVYEAESLQETKSATASLRAQGNCCGITWSNNAQLLFRATEVGDTFTVGGRSFTVTDGGAYDFSAVLTRGPDYGAYQLAIDGREIDALRRLQPHGPEDRTPRLRQGAAPEGLPHAYAHRDR